MRKQGLNYTVLSEATAYDSRNGCNALIEAATNTLLTGCKKNIYKKIKILMIKLLQCLFFCIFAADC